MEDSWRQQIDTDKLTDWMTSQGLGHGALENIRALTGGTQNILLRFKRDGRDYVLRCPPANPRLDGNKTIQREITVLTALAQTNVPHPRLIAPCPDKDVLGRAFYLMEPVEGFTATQTLPELHASRPDIRRQMGFEFLNAGLTLAAVDYIAVGLEGFGRPENFLDRQVSRWRGQLDSYHDFAGWPGPDGLPHVAEISEWLAARTPATFTPGIMHGDFHMANVMFRNDGPEIAAIVDWELATIGDPLIDMGWAIATWPEDIGPDRNTSDMIKWEGLPNIAELIDYYSARTKRDMSSINWYAVLGCYKLSILLEGTYARASAGKAPKEVGDRLHAGAIRLMKRAMAFIEQGDRFGQNG